MIVLLAIHDYIQIIILKLYMYLVMSDYLHHL